MTSQTFNFFVVVEMILCYSYSRILVQIDAIVIRLLVASFDDKSVDSSNDDIVQLKNHHHQYHHHHIIDGLLGCQSFRISIHHLAILLRMVHVCIVPTSIIIIIARIICLDKCDAMRLFCFMDIRCYIAAQWCTSLSRLIRVDCHDMFDASSYY